MIINQELKDLQAKSDYLLSNLEDRIYELKELSNDLEEFIDMNAMINCLTITKLVKLGFVPEKNILVKNDDGSKMKIYTISRYNAQSLSCSEKDGSIVNISYNAILKMIDLGRIELCNNTENEVKA